MAVTNLTVLNPADKTKQQIEAIGTGAIAAADTVLLDASIYPVGSRYFDTAARILYVRATASSPGVVGDWYKTAALTQQT